eukprot:TRINITY_DN3755_c0_g5_i1.p1 TRINITY_DN3755_c0_g5~~TRINITY_DN3755_c0_g5_i1.p1  ORF type:complete len:226 (-),score=13.89 TRINITY_DN3755_c0_g5_i1:517-1194(-)
MMLGLIRSRSIERSNHHPHATLSCWLFSHWIHGEGSVQQKYTAHQLQTCFALGCPLTISSVTCICDNGLMALVETVTSYFRTDVHNILSPFLHFLFLVFTRCRFKTTPKVLPSASEDCFVQAQILEQFQRGGPLCIGGRDKCARDDGHTNYINIIQASASMHSVKEGEHVDLAGSSSTLWAVKEVTPRSGRRAGADRKVKKHMRGIDHTAHRPFHDLLEPVDALC